MRQRTETTVNLGQTMNVRKLVPRGAQPAARALFDSAGRVTWRFRMEPSFIIIGGQRCGTTTIFKSLAEHPQVLRPPVDKGTDYYTLNYWRGHDWYRSRFPLKRSARAGTQPRAPFVTFEACTYYMFHPYAIERLASDYPDIRLVAMLRDPVVRAYSAYKHEFARGYDTEPDFMRALELEDSRVEPEIDKLRDAHYESFSHRHHAYRRRGEFAGQLRRVFEHFDPSQVHILDSESFFADPIGEFRALVDFLGIRRWQPSKFRKYNARPSTPMPAQARAFLEEHYRTHDDELAQIIGRRPVWSPGR